MTKIDRETAVTEMQQLIASLIPARKERDSKLAESAQGRCRDYCAFFMTARFAEIAVDCQIDVREMLRDTDDKQLDRLRKMLQALETNTFFLNGESDLNRIAFKIIKTTINAYNLKVAKITKADVSAASNRSAGEVAAYVEPMSRIIEKSTEKRQAEQIAIPVLKMLGFLTTEKVGRSVVGYIPQPKSAFFKRCAKILKEEQAQANVTA